MRRLGLVFGVMALALLALGFNGCGSDKKADDAGGDKKSDASDKDHEDHKDHADHGDHGSNGKTDMEKMKEELAKLSPADAASAEKQHICPVTGKMLGAMGPPKKMEVKGQTVWICCGGCEDSLLGDPDKYLAKLNKD